MTKSRRGSPIRRTARSLSTKANFDNEQPRSAVRFRVAGESGYASASLPVIDFRLLPLACRGSDVRCRRSRAISTSAIVQYSYTTIYDLHASLGLTVLALAGVRIVARLIWPWPALPPGMSLWQRLLTDATHTALYVLMIALPLVGWSIISAPGCCYAAPFVFDSFTLPRLPSTPFPDRAATFAVHSALAWIAMGAIALHAAAALLHHFVFKDDTLAHVIAGLRAKRSGGLKLPEPAGPFAASVDEGAIQYFRIRPSPGQVPKTSDGQ